MLEPFLDADRHRWSWYGEALTGALQATTKLLAPDAHVAFAFPSGNHAMIEAICYGASVSGLALESYLFRPHRDARTTSEFGALRGDYRVVFHPISHAPSATVSSVVGQRLRVTALDAAQDILTERNEPLPFAWLYQRALARVTEANLLTPLADLNLPAYDNPYQFLHRELTNGIKDGYARDFDHWQKKWDDTRVVWFIRDHENAALPLYERV